MDTIPALPPKVAADFQLVLFLVILVNILWYVMKIVLRTNGYQWRWFDHFSDVANMVRLIRATPNTAARVRYIALFGAILVGTGVFIVLAIRLFRDVGAA
jgi:hypothetical protein